MWLGFRTFLLAGVFLLLALAGIIFGVMDQSSWLGRAALIAGAALFVATALMVLYVAVRIRSVRFTITRRLIEREQGVIFKRVDALDLARVKDIELSQSLFDRLVGIGTIVVYSTDKTSPTLLIEAVPNPRPVYEQLRDAVMEITQRRGVVPM
jgi:uncharacterized membrane protein YdbT with pleckstrin-like domain